MKILRVIVDELPKGSYLCHFAYRNTFKPSNRTVETYCRITGNSTVQKQLEAETQLCPDCPLRLEHDNKQIAESVM